jgi:hypothetical protein
MVSGARPSAQTDQQAPFVAPPQSPSARTLAAATGAEASAGSNVRELQELVEARLLDFEPDVGKWPPAATIAFVLVTCGGFWAGVGLIVAQLL